MSVENMKVLSVAQAEAIRSTYVSIVQNNVNFPISSFQYITGSTTNHVNGFTMAIDDMVSLLSQTAVTKYTVYFGMNNSAPANEPAFSLLIRGANEDDSVVTPYYILKNPIAESVSLNADYTTDPDSDGLDFGPVSLILLENWFTSWDNLIDAAVFPSVFFEINLMANGQQQTLPIKAYTFSRIDFEMLVASSGLGTDSVVRLFFVNHAVASSNGSQTQAPGTIGLVIAAYADENTLLGSPTNAFYDFSKPCPPTC